MESSNSVKTKQQGTLVLTMNLHESIILTSVVVTGDAQDISIFFNKQKGARQISLGIRAPGYFIKRVSPDPQSGKHSSQYSPLEQEQTEGKS